MAKYELIARWYHTGVESRELAGKPAGDPIRKIIDPSIDRKYDGASNIEDIRRVFLESITQDPLHNIILRVDKISILKE